MKPPTHNTHVTAASSEAAVTAVPAPECTPGRPLTVRK
jgi:hypothetical protein